MDTRMVKPGVGVDVMDVAIAWVSSGGNVVWEVVGGGVIDSVAVAIGTVVMVVRDGRPKEYDCVLYSPVTRLVRLRGWFSA
jgi:hypothetical protein